MSDKQIEDMLTELIRIVGNTNAAIEELRSDAKDLKMEVGDLKAEVGDLKVEVGILKIKVGDLTTRVDTLEAIVKNNHQQVMGELKAFRTDLDFLQQKTNQNERDIYRIKKLITG